MASTAAHTAGSLTHTPHTQCFMSQLELTVSSTGILESSVADPDPGSGIGYLFDPWIRDPGWEKVSIRIRDPGSRMNNPDHIF
jgi:hypothetical protein